jgi:hypothetical protein
MPFQRLKISIFRGFNAPGVRTPIELCVVKNSQVYQDGSDSFYCESGEINSRGGK